MIKVDVERVVIYGKDLIVLLRPPGDERVLPIHVDPSQAHAIELKLEGLPFPRPLTHDLFKSALDAIGCKVMRVEVTDLIEGTFFARLVLFSGGKEIMVDARPSDAIALALRCLADILVNEEIMDKAGVVVKPEPRKKSGRKLTEAELLEQKLQQAVDEERYEDAAGLRDRIKGLKENKAHN